MKLMTRVILFSLTLTACSAKISGGADDKSVPQQKAFVDEASGPDLTGHWRSGCTHSPLGDRFGTSETVIDFSQRDVKYVIIQHAYPDLQCQGVGSKTEYTGKYRYVLDKRDGNYEIEFMLKSADGFAFRAADELEVTSDFKMSIGDFGNTSMAPYIDLTKTADQGVQQ